MNNAFEFGGFRKPPIDVEYKPHDSVPEGQGVMMKLNLELLTLDRMEQIDAEFEATLKSVEQEIDETAKGKKLLTEGGGAKKPARSDAGGNNVGIFAFDRALLRMKIIMLAGAPGADQDKPFDRLIHSWNVVEGGAPVAITFENIARLPSAQIERLYAFATGEANKPTAKEKKRSGSTSTTPSTSEMSSSDGQEG